VRARGEITVTVAAADYLEVARPLRDDAALRFEQLIDLCGMDYSRLPEDQPWDGPRFARCRTCCRSALNWRVRLKVFATDDDVPVLPTLTDLWSRPTGSSARPSTCTASSSTVTTTCAAS
jgi:NADH-quinone oxidoreductase subunit C